MSTSLRHVCLLVILLVCIASLSVAQSAPPSADTFATSAYPTATHGASPALTVGPGTTSYIQFNLSTLPPGVSVSKATLRLYVNGVYKPGSFDVYELDTAWSENTLTYSTAPPLGTSATASHPVQIFASSLHDFVLIDITPLVQNWVSGAITNNGVALALTSAGSYFSFDSKESAQTSQGPELEIALADNGTQGPPGPAGPQGPGGPVGVSGPAGPAGPQGIPGPTGPTGSMGLTGAQGLQGDAGPAGPAGPVGPGLAFRGPFDANVLYAINDAVSFNGSSYVAMAATKVGDPAPDANPAWSLMAQQGTTGPAGPAGPAGPQGAPGPTGPPGPISGVTAGAGLTGGGTVGNVILSLDTTKVPQLNSVNTFTGNQTVNGNLSATGVVTGSGYQIGSNLFAFGSMSAENVYLGFAGNSAGAGVANTGVGSSALAALTTGNGNTAIGGEALFANTTGPNNTATGTAALRYNTTGTSNTANGYNALSYNLTGGYNTANGIQALQNNISGSFNTASGDAALGANTTGTSNTAVGNIALRYNTSGSYNTATGDSALEHTTSSYNTAYGFESLQSNTTGVNTAVGAGSLYSNNTGSDNTAIGVHALYFNTTGNNNIAVGDLALGSNTGGYLNVALGWETLINNASGSYNTALGAFANAGSPALTNATAIGSKAEVDASNSLVLGSISGVNDCSPANYCGDTNVGIGITAPAYKLHVGIGGNGFRVEGPATAGTGLPAASFGGYGDFGIDSPGLPQGRFVVKEDGKVGIGDTPSNILTVQKGGGHAIADGWDTYSSRRWKTNIHPLADALSKVEQLRGVSYDLKQSGKHEIGVIAEEVGAVVPEVVTYEDNGRDARGVDYSRLTALLIEAVKQQQTQIREQRAQIQSELWRIKVQQQEIVRLGNKLHVLEAASTGVSPRRPSKKLITSTPRKHGMRGASPIPADPLTQSAHLFRLTH